MTSPTRAIAITALTTISLCLLIGCGGGASATPTVTYKAGGQSADSGDGP